MMRVFFKIIGLFLGLSIVTPSILLSANQELTSDYIYDEFDAMAPVTPPKLPHKPSSCEIFFKRCAIAALLKGIDIFEYFKARCGAFKRFFYRLIHAT